MAIDFNLPTLTTLKATYLTYIRDNIIAIAKMDFTGASNIPTGAVRWNDSSNIFEKWSGSAWGPLGGLAGVAAVNNANWSGTDLSVLNGGTGASAGAGALTNLGAATSGHGHSIGMELVETKTLSGDGDTTFNSLSPGVQYRMFINVSFSTSQLAASMSINGDTTNPNYIAATQHVGFDSGTATGATWLGAANQSYAPWYWINIHMLYATSLISEIQFVTVPGDNTLVHGMINTFSYKDTNDYTITQTGFMYNGSAALSSMTIFPSPSGTMTGTMKLCKLI